MVSSKKEHPKLNPNKPKKRSVKDLVIKKFDNSNSTADYSSEFKNSSDEEDVESQTNEKILETENNFIKDGEIDSKPFDSMRDVTKHIDSEEDSKLKTNPTLDDFMKTRPKLREEVILEVEEVVEESEELSEGKSIEKVDKKSEESKGETKEEKLSINPIKEVIKKLEHEPTPSKPTLNPSPNDLKPKESVNPIKDVIKKTESEVKSASDNTIDSVRGVIKKLDSETDFKPTLNPSPNDLPKTRQFIEEEKTSEEIEESEDSDEKEKIRREIEEYDDSEIPKELKFSSNILELKIGVFGHKIKIIDIVVVFIGLFLILCGGIASAGVVEKLVDNVVFGERSTISFLLVIMGILFISSVLGPALIKRSSFRGFYEQLQSVDAEQKDTISDDSKEENNLKESTKNDSED